MVIWGNVGSGAQRYFLKRKKKKPKLSALEKTAKKGKTVLRH